MKIFPYATKLMLGSTVIFSLAIFHTFLVPWFYKCAEKQKEKQFLFNPSWKLHFVYEQIFTLLSKIEVIFCLWMFPLFLLFIYIEGWPVTIAYFNSRNYIFSLYICLLVLVIDTRPILFFTDRVLNLVALLGKGSPKFWWWILLTIPPMLSVFVKETGAMILAASLLLNKFYYYKPSKKFSYATLSLLFSNISLGGLLSLYSSRAFIMLSSHASWNNRFVFVHFSWKACIIILLSTTLYYFIFRKEFDLFPKNVGKYITKIATTPWWMVFIHVIWVILVVMSKSQGFLIVLLLLLFLAFHRVTFFYQNPLHLSQVALVGLFFTSLVIHGDLQEWWVNIMGEKLSSFGLMIGAFGLSSLLDNAMVNYLSLDIPSFTECCRYVAISGAMSAGSMTIMANVPNIMGYVILKPAFQNSVSFLEILKWSLIPALISFLIFWFLREYPAFPTCSF